MCNNDGLSILCQKIEKFLRLTGALNTLNSPYDLHCLGLAIYTECTILNALVTSGWPNNIGRITTFVRNYFSYIV